VDSAVGRLLLESIFHPGGTLHDGAVIVRRDRIAAAACLFPLTENLEIARSTGTRHRAALGITDETDAVAVVVSEETGAISLCRRGRLSDVTPDRLEGELRSALETGETVAERGAEGARSALGRLGSWLTRDAAWIALAGILAGGILYFVHQNISGSREFHLRVAVGEPGEQAAPGELLVVPVGSGWHVDGLDELESARAIATGTRAQLDALGRAPGGVFEIREPAAGLFTVDLGGVIWTENANVDFEWASKQSPAVELRRTEQRIVTVPAELIELDTAELDPRYEVLEGGVALVDPDHALEGPPDLLDRVATGAVALRFEPVALAPTDDRDRSARVDLTEELRAEGLVLAEGPIEVRIPIRPAARALGEVEVPLALVCLDPARAPELGLWALPARSQRARFTILTEGLVPAADPESPAVRDAIAAVRSVVAENLVAFVDVAELDGGQAAPVRWLWREDWRSALEALGVARGGGRESLAVRIESDAEILLVERGTEVEPVPSDPAARPIDERSDRP
jgi:hypothetical protein